MAATIQVTHYTDATGSTRTRVDGSSVLKWNRSDDNATTAPIPIPTAAGTNFSWYKALGLQCTGNAGTTLSNLRITSATAPSGMAVMAKDGTATYTQAASGNKAADAGTNANTPTGYTALTNYAGGGVASLTWDATGAATAVQNAPIGHYVYVCIGVDNTYAGGGGTNQTAPTLTLTYDEA